MQVKPGGMAVRVPAGRYFLGDPCYAVPDNAGQWDTLLDSCGHFGLDDGPQSSPVGTVLGHQVLGFPTAHGDGAYFDQDGNEYPVDAGLIGLTPEVLYRQVEDQDWLRKAGMIVDLAEETLCTTDGSLLVFGTHQINTDPDGDTSDSEDFDDEDDEDGFDEED